MNRLIWLKLVFLRYYRHMGLRVLLYALLSFAATLISPVANTLIGGRIGPEVGFSSVTPVLTILASSMLAVSTFSLNIMVSTHRAAADDATPRMHPILLEDTTTQSTLAAFIGAFVYSLGSLVLFRLDFYPQDAAVAVMGITTLVVIWVIISLLRWINHLTTLGSLENSLKLAETRARVALRAHAQHPRFGASALTATTVMPSSTTPLRAPESGYVQLIDMGMLEDCLPDQCSIYLTVNPGMHVLADQTIGEVSGALGSDTLARLARAFTLGHVRTHEQDAEFGLVVLSQIASKALSPGINDPGTAIDTINVLKSLLWDYAREPEIETASKSPRVIVSFPTASDFVDAAFASLARDGARTVDVAVTLRKALLALSASQNSEMAAAAHIFSQAAVEISKEAGMSERDLARLQSID